MLFRELRLLSSLYGKPPRVHPCVGRSQFLANRQEQNLEVIQMLAQPSLHLQTHRPLLVAEGKDSLVQVKPMP